LADRSVHIQTILKSLPDNPGVYQYYDEDGKILYVGKAKSLKKRVMSYFVKEHDHSKTRVLVSKIADIRTIIVDTEVDALLLENNLIKKYQPRYNVMLKDDKTYPWICIKKERFPRVFPTRKFIRDGSEYFGPYSSVKLMYALMDMIKQLYPLRTCTLDLAEHNIIKGKFRPCLDFHIGNCKAPCVQFQSEEDYLESIRQIRNLLKGNYASTIRELKEKMKELSEQMEFEKAQQVKDKIEVLESYQSKSTIVNPSITDVDVFTIISDENTAYVNYFKVMNGSIVQGHTIELRKKIDESDEEMLVFAINELRNRFHSTSKEIYLPFEIDEHYFPDAKITVPKIGDKKQLVELSQRNAANYKKERDTQVMLVDPERHTKRIMQQMMKDLRLTEEPRRIEAFDNSNIQGAYAVAAMPVFIDGKPAKKEYRHFNIKTVEGPDDFASMEEVIYRRYKRVLEEELPFPNLIVIDGGKGQLGAALNSLEKLGLVGKVAVIGIAKRLEEIYYPGDPLPMYIDKKSETLRVIQHIRDEAHRFGITHHRNKRSKGTIKSELTEIKGISNATTQKLLSTFKSVKAIKEKSEAELAEVIGKAKAKIVFEHFANKAASV
jgi:excinuclease ABC subunit C